MRRTKERKISTFFFKKANVEAEDTSTPNPPPSQVCEQNESPLINTPPPLETEQNEPEISHLFEETNEIELDQEVQLDIEPNSTQAPMGDERLSEFDVLNLPQDPGKRKSILDFHPDDRDAIRREYIQRKPCQPDYEFPKRLFGKSMRRFNPKWFGKYKSWLEYSVTKDAAFCFVCYLFKDENSAGGDAFVGEGFRTWSKTSALEKHVGGHMSAHNQALEALEDFKNQKGSLPSRFAKQSVEGRIQYRKRLEASIETLSWLLLQGLPFRGHDEKETSLNRGNFLELLKLLAKHDPEYKDVVLKNAPRNSQMIAPSIQRDIINACAKETTKVIIEDLNDDLFAILADESADISDREQLALCLRFVNRRGEVTERFLGIVHVANTTSLTLKLAIESLLMEHSLSLSRVRGQGYDGASNMKGAINGLKTLITDECSSAHYVHCFAHQLQLTLVAVAKKNIDCGWLFADVLAPLLNFVGGSPKRKEFLREKQKQRVVDALSLGELESGTGLNQEISLSRPGDTRWGSHFRTISHVIDLYPVILESLDEIGDISDSVDQNKAETLTQLLMSFDFIFLAHLMLDIFGITNDLNLALQKAEQDIVNAMTLVDVTKGNLQKLRDNGWDHMMDKVTSFMAKYDIEIPNMEGTYIVPGRRKFRVSKPKVTNIHHFRVEVFLSVIDLQLQELENRFDEVSTEILVCMSCFNPSNRFLSFDTTKLVRLAEFYPNEFPSVDLLTFHRSLENFIGDVRKDERFWNLKSLNELSVKLVETGKHETYPSVYMLLKLVLLLLVATASVERAFSGMTHIKNKLRSSMGDQLLNDCLVTYLEKDLFLRVSMDDIVNRFQNMRTRREQL